MQRRGTQLLIVLGICWLCFAGTVLAQTSQSNVSQSTISQSNQSNTGPGAPEIDVGAATGALTIAAGALTLLRERLRRPSA